MKRVKRLSGQPLRRASLCLSHTLGTPLSHPGYTSLSTLGIPSLSPPWVYPSLTTLGIPLPSHPGYTSPFTPWVYASSTPWVYASLYTLDNTTLCTPLGIPPVVHPWVYHPLYTLRYMPPYCTHPEVHASLLYTPWVHLLVHPGYTSLYTLGIPLFSASQDPRVYLSSQPLRTLGEEEKPLRREPPRLRREGETSAQRASRVRSEG